MNAVQWAGQKISENGLYSGIPIDAYHGDVCDGPSISSSGLRMIESKSPAHYWATSSLNPDREPESEKAHFDFGRAAHTLMLGETGFKDKFAVRPEQWSDWRTKASQEWKAEQRDAGKSILTPEDIHAIRGIAHSLALDPLIQQGILQGSVEHSMIWKDQTSGMWLKSRPDVIPSADGVLVDLKTTTDASSNAVARAILDHGYAMQGALAGMGMQEILKVPMTDFVLVFVEKSAPYAVNTVIVDPNWIFWATKQVRRAISRFAECVKAGEWPSYDSDKTIFMPSWLEKRFEDELNNGLLPKENAA